MVAGVAPAQRFTANRPCPACGGHKDLPSGRDQRCYGYLSDDGRYARCTREDAAGSLDRNDDGTYSHFLEGPCRCGAIHGDPPRRETVSQNGSTRKAVRDERHVLHDASGQPLFVHRRKYFDDGSKRVWWEQLDGTAGLDGFKVADLPLSGIHELNGSKRVLVTEGEPARDALARLGVAALGTACGASTLPSEETLRPLIGRDVILWPDADKDGLGHMQRIARRLIAMGQPRERIRVIAWTDAPEKGDAADATPDDVPGLIRDAGPCDELLSDTPKEEVVSERKLRFLTAREIAAMTPVKTDFLVGGYVVSGGITNIDGKVKAAGKTTFTLALCRAVLDGLPFMGFPTKQSPVVYLTEQTPASFRQALDRAGLSDRDDFHVLYWHDTVGMSWPEIVSAAEAYCRQVGAELLIVDTFGQFTGLKGDAENNSGATLEAMQPLQAAAARGLGIIILRHERKSGGDVGDSGRGSSAIPGAVDIIISLRRAEGASRPTIRHLHALSRFDETPDLLVIEMTPAGYVNLGTETSVAEAEARDAILNAAPINEDDAIKEADLIEAAEVKRTNARKAIDEHLSAGRLQRVGAGKRGDPFRYWRRDGAKVSDGSPQLTVSESNESAGEAEGSVSDTTQDPLSESNDGYDEEVF